MTITDTVPAATTAPPTAPPTSDGEDRRLRTLEEQVRDLDRRVENNRLIRDAWTLIIFAVAVVALLASVIAVGFGMRAIDEAEQGPAAVGATVAGVLT